MQVIHTCMTLVTHINVVGLLGYYCSYTLKSWHTYARLDPYDCGDQPNGASAYSSTLQRTAVHCIQKLQCAAVFFHCRPGIQRLPPVIHIYVVGLDESHTYIHDSSHRYKCRRALVISLIHVEVMTYICTTWSVWLQRATDWRKRLFEYAGEGQRVRESERRKKPWPTQWAHQGLTSNSVTVYIPEPPPPPPTPPPPPPPPPHQPFPPP